METKTRKRNNDEKEIREKSKIPEKSEDQKEKRTQRDKVSKKKNQDNGQKRNSNSHEASQEPSKVFVPKRYVPPYATQCEIAMYLVRKRYVKVEDILTEYKKKNDDYLVRNSARIILASHFCMEKVYGVIQNGEVTPQHKDEMEELRCMSENIYQHLGGIFYAKSAILKNRTNSFICGMLKCFLSLSPHAMTQSHRIGLTQMGILVDTALLKSCSRFLCASIDMGPYDTCYIITLRIRRALVSFGYEMSEAHKALDITEMIQLAKTGLTAAKKTRFTPWILVFLLNQVYTTAKRFGFARLANYRYRTDLMPTETLLEAHGETIRALKALREFMPNVCNEEIHHFVNVLECVVVKGLDALQLPMPRQICPRVPHSCWKVSCSHPLHSVFGDITQRFGVVKCKPAPKKLPIHERRPAPVPVWKRKSHHSL